MGEPGGQEGKNVSRELDTGKAGLARECCPVRATVLHRGRKLPLGIYRRCLVSQHTVTKCPALSATDWPAFFSASHSPDCSGASSTWRFLSQAGEPLSSPPACTWFLPRRSVLSSPPPRLLIGFFRRGPTHLRARLPQASLGPPQGRV